MASFQMLHREEIVWPPRRLFGFDEGIQFKEAAGSERKIERNTVAESLFITVYSHHLPQAGIFIMLNTGHCLVGLWVMLMAGSFLGRVKTYGRFYQSVFYPPGMDETARQVVLTLTPEGMEEKTGRVTSFAPWSAVTGAELLEDLLVIGLASKQ